MWSEVPLDQLGYVSRGRSRHRPRNDPVLYGGVHPFIQTGDVKAAGLRITTHSQTYGEAGLAQSRLWPENTLCITIAANIGDTALLSYPACFPDSIIGFVGDERKCDVRFVKYCFDMVQERMRMVSQGATQDNLSQDKLLRFGIPCPPLETQVAIGDMLSAYDDLMETNHRRIALLEESTRLLYREWFVNLRFPGHEQGSGANGIPQGWSVGCVHDHVHVLSGGTPATRTARFWGGEIPFFTPKDCRDSIYALRTEKSLTQEGLAACNSRLYPRETIFVTARGTVGKLALAQRPMAMNQSCYAITPKTNGLDNLFLFLALEAGVSHLKTMGLGRRVRRHRC
jgi:type I restriction enzyme S subunit